jgi:[ribosomal protein S18]-alanine N-acetyltransferase
LTPSTTQAESFVVVTASSEADLDDVMEIDQLSFPTPWVRQAFADEMARPWARLELLREMPGGRAVGFCNYWLVTDELHILNIAVHPAFRKRGHASALARHIVDVAKANKVRVLLLEVRVTNTAARSLYQKLGFRQVGVRPRYYADNGEDAVLMDLDMGNP